MGRYIRSRIWRMLQVRVIFPFLTFVVLYQLSARSNALTLERVTSEYPKSGSLITFCQFLLVSLHGLPKFIEVTRGPLNIPIPRLRPRRLPLTSYLIQVALFYFVSLLNNLAFGYNIPMPVHIIFRSGGLVVSMLMGWLLSRKS
jgi:solute carrier family 35 (UDP-xylose/UDP-N-acetylglucosamine transporter), member B4